MLLPSLSCSTCPCPKGMYQLTGKLPILLSSQSFHLTWKIPQITNPFLYSPLLASYLKNIFTLSFTNSVSNTTLSPLLNLAFFLIGPLHLPFSLQATLFTLFYKLINWFACFHDLKMALDSVLLKPLIDLLFSLHFTLYLINWLHSYLSSRPQPIIVPGIGSSHLP